MNDIRNTRRDANDRVFRQDVLHFLERIAIALENNGPIAATPLAPLDSDQEPYFNSDATVCSCGNDPKRGCSQCTPARMAWFYNMNPGWQQ
jgi:hypothetical protein